METHKSFDSATVPEWDDAAKVFTVGNKALAGHIHEVAVRGLDGGVYAVEVIQEGQTTPVASTTAALAENQPHRIDRFGLEVIKVSCSGLGGSAAPVLHLYSRPRTW